MIHVLRKPDWFLTVLLAGFTLAEVMLLGQIVDLAPARIQDAPWLFAFAMLGMPYLVSAFFLFRWLALGLTVLMILSTLFFGKLIVLGPNGLGWPFQPEVLTFTVLAPWQMLVALVWLPVTTGVLMTKSRKRIAKALEIDGLIEKRRQIIQQRKNGLAQSDEKQQREQQEALDLLEAEELPEALPAPRELEG